MIYLHASKTLLDDLKKARCTEKMATDESNDWQWHAHRVTLIRKKCVILMEEETRYALIFIGLKKSDFLNFEAPVLANIIQHML